MRKVLIGVIGAQRRAGCTHTALSVGGYLRERKKTVAVVEMNATEAFAEIGEACSAEKGEGDCFRYGGIDYYPDASDRSVQLLGLDYDFFVLDFGEYEIADKLLFNRCDICIVCSGANAWEVSELGRIFEEQPEEVLKNYHFCFRHTTDKAQKEIRKEMKPLKNIWFPKLQEDPLTAGKHDFEGGEDIFADYVPREKKRSGILLAAARRKQKKTEPQKQEPGKIPEQEKMPEKEKTPEKQSKKKQKPKKPQKQGYVMKKNTSMRVLRVVFWAMLSFLFIRGVASCFQRDKADEVNALIRDFKANYMRITNENEEVMAFAQNFAREYLTYTVKGETDYKARLAPYVAKNFFGGEAVNDFSAAAEAVYVKAYRMEEYNGAQKDVYVLAEVEYAESCEPLVLKVPVYCDGGGYVVEGLPVLVADNMLAAYMPENFYGTALSDTAAQAVAVSVENFLKAYYEQDESVIDYYLSTEADKGGFMGLTGRFSYYGMNNIKCYQGETGIICLADYKIRDAENNVKMLQKVNLLVEESGGRYYIRSMDARTGNLKLN